MQSYCQLNGAQIGRKMSTGRRNGSDQMLTNLQTELLGLFIPHMVQVELLQLTIAQHRIPPFLFRH
jgi:hypothetical protein